MGICKKCGKVVNVSLEGLCRSCNNFSTGTVYILDPETWEWTKEER